MKTVASLIPASSNLQEPNPVIKPVPPRDTTESLDKKEVRLDTELFIRMVFESDPQKGCELLFRHYYRPMCTHASRFVYSKEIAEDLVADVFYTFWNTKAYQTVKQSYRAYLFSSVRNRSYNYLANEFKKHDMLELNDDQAASPADLPVSMMCYEELYHKVDQLVSALPPQCRHIFIMYRFESRKAKEIAQELNISVRTVEFHIGKALTALKLGLKNQWLITAFLFFTKNLLIA